MKDGPNIARIASLLGDSARADALTALLADRALTATELAAIAGVTKQTMSAHLSKLLQASLIAVDRQGRHRYFRLADEDVGGLLESLMGVAFRTGAVRLVSSPREPALRKARVCYDHLAGELGVLAYESLLRNDRLTMSAQGLRPSVSGAQWFKNIGIDTELAMRQRRSYCRPCMDWSERRYHLAGSLGAALLSRVCDLGWAKRDKASRVVRFNANGERRFRDLVNAKRNTIASVPRQLTTRKTP
jgi:DNA-binding transcriptional ArsR family regulator